MTDKKALSLLKRAYDAPLNTAEQQYCQDKGVMTDSPSATHDELILLIKQAAERVTQERAAEGFLYSITSGDIRYRTALSSLIWARALPKHECSASYVYERYYYCDVCGAKLSTENDKTCLDMALYARQRLLPEKNFMDTCCAGYVLNDLRLFAELPEVRCCDRDIEVLNRIFGLAKEISPQNKATALLKLITTEKQLGLKAGDAYSVLGVLSACGVFDTPEYKSYANGFTGCIERGFVYETDIYYPLNHWRGKHGINYDAIRRIFGEQMYKRLAPDTAVNGAVKRADAAKSPTKSAAESYFRDGEHFIDLDDRMRYYYGLSPLDPSWDREVRFSVTHDLRKRTEIYFEGDTVKKLIYEERFGDSSYRGYVES
ncbi:MAG: hypothetical protein E7478_04940, partial [Ruminococcaceae bacterium]|nr:hypothetical protein [Oscillospiraceae bacterium]